MVVKTTLSRIKKWAIAGIAGTLAFALAACGSTASNSNNGVDKDAVITVNSVEPTGELLPGNVSDTASWKIATQLFDGLVTFTNKGELVMDEAESITPNDDASVYTIKLKDGLKFSNGEAITANTYARAWSYAANVTNAQVGASIFSTIKGYDDLQVEGVDPNAQLSGLRVVDDKTLEVTLNAPDSSFSYKVGDVAFLPIPSVAYDDIHGFGKNPTVSNGPYVLQEWNVNKDIKLKKNDQYSGVRTPKNAGIDYVVYDSLDTAYSDLQSGNLDVLDAIPTSALSTFKNDSSIQAFSDSSSAFKSITIPQNLEHFSGEEGALRRQAISYAIDRENVIDKILSGAATPATDFLAPVIAGYSKTLSGNDVLKYDAQKAKQLWEQANAISPWSGTFTIAYNADGPYKAWVDAVANSISNSLGIEAQGNEYATNSEFSSAVNKRQINGAFRSGLQSDYPHPEGYLFQAYDSASADGKGLNNGDYKSSEFDGFMDQAASETNLDDAIKTYQQSEELLLKDLPVIPLWYDNVSAGATQKMKTVKFNYMGLPSYYELEKTR
ncbi:ABC transporter substrate-binding protein [Alloscardovia theropitheci]|uniref:ABC transporter substrate-binding protein n=1 Tax=Alloscardovia theropitheci TaxID=2496842 RepID=A0A4R0QWY1_9BIFI|nr:ABC transporter substrate-binding protein [Alloscardovia theropitheci]TCD54040.1 ABC transporter substrate-binding protein [Alloscardovia theropitheci]